MIYLDNAASTKMHPDVIDAMTSHITGQYGNPSSIHKHGRSAKKAVSAARKQVASLINAEPGEIFFTSGGTESNNMAIMGFALHARRERRRCVIITSAVEHDAILEPCRDLEAERLARIEYVPVDRYGTVNLDALESLLSYADLHSGKKDKPHNAENHNDNGKSPRTHPQQQFTSHSSSSLSTPAQPGDFVPSNLPPLTLVSIMYANNEVGTIQPVSDVAQLCKGAGALFHTDAVQAAGKIPVDVARLGADMLSLSSHKIHGPQGVGALYVRRSAEFKPRMLGGGGQEKGMRSGTENVAGIVGFGSACVIARANMAQNMLHTRTLRDALTRSIMQRIPYCTLNGSKTNRLDGNAHFTFLGINGEDLLIKLDEHGVAASTGSACSVNKQRASHVLEAMGFEHEQITGSLRLTLGVMNTQEDVDATVDVLDKIVSELRAVSPFAQKYGLGAG